MKTILIFPPNWSACVSGPHLALPLIAGAIKTTGEEVVLMDLSEEFYRIYGKQPSNEQIRVACDNEDINKLDDLYFEWEDSFALLAKKHDHQFGLLSGFTNGNFTGRNINELSKKLNTGTVFTDYFETTVRERIIRHNPDIIGVSVSSYHQIFPAIELVHRIKRWLPLCKIVLGGNILTRLQNSESFTQILNLVDKVIIYQGESSIIEYLNQLSKKENSAKVSASEKIEYGAWPVPVFDGLNYGNYPGGVNTLSYVSARGCYYGKCSFCAIPAGWSKSGYAGSAPGDFVVNQIKKIITATGINKIKFVDEAFLPSKVESIRKYSELFNVSFLWEAYARLEKVWETDELIKAAYTSGCRRLYFGLEMAPEANRVPLLKNDKGNIMTIMEKCKKYGILVHLFCMVGHPGTTIRDAELTVQFLIDNQELIDTSDLVGFRLDRGTNVLGVRKTEKSYSDFLMSYEYEPIIEGNLSYKQVFELEAICQEVLWEEVPRLLHPLYRIGNNWESNFEHKQPALMKQF